jgi:hypothetical protein
MQSTAVISVKFYESNAKNYSTINNDRVFQQYLRHLSGVDSVVDPPKFSHLGDYLINTNGIGHFRKQF